MTFERFTSAELLTARRQQKAGWSVAQIAEYWHRERDEVDLAMWLMIDRWHHLTNARNYVNRRLAMRAALTSLPSELAAA